MQPNNKWIVRLIVEVEVESETETDAEQKGLLETEIETNDAELIDINIMEAIQLKK